MLEFAFLGFVGIALALLILWYSRKFANLEAQVSRLRSEIENLRSLVERRQREVETPPPQSAAVETPEASIPAGLRSESEAPFHPPSMPPMAGDTPLPQHAPRRHGRAVLRSSRRWSAATGS